MLTISRSVRMPSSTEMDKCHVKKLKFDFEHNYFNQTRVVVPKLAWYSFAIPLKIKCQPYRPIVQTH